MAMEGRDRAGLTAGLGALTELLGCTARVRWANTTSLPLSRVVGATLPRQAEVDGLGL